MAQQNQEIIKAIAITASDMKDMLKGSQIVLFGSRARGDAWKRSDFDIGIISETPLSSSIIFAFEDRLDRIPTLHKIDVVDFSKVSSKFKKEALKHTYTIFP